MSTTITVRRRLKSRPEDVYAVFADSARLARVPGIGVDVIEPGSDGVGVLRRIGLPGGLFLLERVVGLNPNALVFDYRIEDSRPGFRHEWGRIACAADGDGSRVTWTSRASVPLGVLTPSSSWAPRRARTPRSRSP